eukprot:12429552-Karenia_brevis.AAC.1
MEDLEEHVCYCLDLDDASIQNEDWQEYIGSKDVAYSGNMSGEAESLAWDLMLPGLPPQQCAGRLDALDIAD